MTRTPPDNERCQRPNRPRSKALAAAAPASPPSLVDRWWFNALWFQVFWLCSLLLQNQGLAITLPLLALHLGLCRRPWRELLCLLPVAALGVAVDSALSLGGIFIFPPTASGYLPVPTWLILLWLAFATTLTRSLNPLRRNAWLAMAMGLPAALNYLAGARLDVVSFAHGDSITLMMLAPIWMVLLPVLCAVTDAVRKEA